MRVPRASLGAPARLPVVILIAWAAFAPAAWSADGAGRSASRLVPARGLTCYLESEGLDAHAEAWKATAASQILNGTPAGATMTDVARTTLARLFGLVPDIGLKADDLIALQDRLAHRGFAFASHEVDGASSWAILLRDFGRKEDLDRFQRLLHLTRKVVADTTRVRGRDLHTHRGPEAGFAGIKVPQAGPTWWLEGDTLVLVGGAQAAMDDALSRPDAAQKQLDDRHRSRVEAVLDAIAGKAPDASTHPALVAALAQGRDIRGFEPTGVFLVQSSGNAGFVAQFGMGPSAPGHSPDESDIAEILGLSQARRVSGRWGFRGKALLTDARFEFPGPFKGMVGTLDPAGFPRDRLPPIPRRSGAFSVGSTRRRLDAESLAILGSILKPEYRPFAEASTRILEDAENRRRLEDVLSQLAPTWALYAAPAVDDGNGKEASPALLIGVRDSARLAESLDALAKRLNAFLRDQEFGAEPGPADRPASLALERLPEPARGYALTSPSGGIAWLTLRNRPTILLGRSNLALAANPDLARAAIAAESSPSDRREWPADSATHLDALPDRLAFLAVGDPRDSSWPEGLANLPRTAAPVLGAFLGLDLGGEAQEDPAPGGLLGLLGARRAGGPTPRWADDVRARLFPSLLAVTVEDRSVRVLRIEALPLGCLGLTGTYGKQGQGKFFNLGLKFGPGR